MLGLAMACAPLACVQAEFIRTDGGFVAHERADQPSVYVDRLPSQPYLAVGIIEVKGDAMVGLAEVLAVAADKGREVGCDVVVDRAIHRVAMGDEGNRRFVVVLGERLRRGSDSGVAAARPMPDLVAQTTPGYYPVVVVPPQKHEYVCGIFREKASQPGATAATEDPSVGMGKVLWNRLSNDEGRKADCHAIHEILSRDAECRGEQCRAALLLSGEYVKKCPPSEDEAEPLSALFARWGTEAPGAGSSTCVRALKNAVRTQEAARRYPLLCASSRPLGSVEQAAIERTLSGD